MPQTTSQPVRKFNIIGIIIPIAMFVGLGLIHAALAAVLEEEVFLRAATGLSIAVMLTIVTLTLLRFRRPQVIGRASQIMAMVTPLVTAAVYALAMADGMSKGFVLMVPLGAVGVGAGILLSRTAKMQAAGRRVAVRNGYWWFAIWAVSFVGVQGLILLEQPDAAALAILALSLTSGMAAGAALGRLIRMGKVLRQASTVTTLQASGPVIGAGLLLAAALLTAPAGAQVDTGGPVRNHYSISVQMDILKRFMDDKATKRKRKRELAEIKVDDRGRFTVSMGMGKLSNSTYYCNAGVSVSGVIDPKTGKVSNVKVQGSGHAGRHGAGNETYDYVGKAKASLSRDGKGFRLTGSYSGNLVHKYSHSGSSDEHAGTRAKKGTISGSFSGAITGDFVAVLAKNLPKPGDDDKPPDDRDDSDGMRPDKGSAFSTQQDVYDAAAAINAGLAAALGIAFGAANGVFGGPTIDDPQGYEYTAPPEETPQQEKERLRAELQEKMDEWAADADKFGDDADDYHKALWAAKIIGWAADRGVDTLGTLVGPAGVYIVGGYNFVKGAGEYVSQQVTDGKDVNGYVLVGKGTWAVVWDLAKGKAIGTIGIKGPVHTNMQGVDISDAGKYAGDFVPGAIESTISWGIDQGIDLGGKIAEALPPKTPSGAPAKPTTYTPPKNPYTRSGYPGGYGPKD